MIMDVRETYDKFCSMFLDGRFTHVGIDSIYRVFRFNKDTHFERHNAMPVQFTQDMFFSEEGRLAIMQRIINEGDYFFGFTKETKSDDPMMFICDTLIPTFTRERTVEEVDNPNLSEDIQLTLDYFRYNRQFNVSMAIDVARGFIDAADDDDLCHIFTSPMLNWTWEECAPKIVKELLQDYADVYDIVVELYNKEIWRRND